MCGISKQIAEYVNEEEAFCPKCLGNMHYENNSNEVLTCIDCHHKVYLEDADYE